MRRTLIAALLCALPALAAGVDYRVRWQPVADAATYVLYDADTANAVATLPACGACVAPAPTPCCQATVTAAPLARAFATAVNGAGESAPSNVVTVAQATATTTTLGSPPTTSTTLGNPTGLLAAYGFDEECCPSTLLDVSGNERHGELGTAVRIADGRFGRAISMQNGTAAGGVATAPAPGAVRTAMAWVRPAGLAGWRCPLSNWSGGDAWYLCLVNAQGAPGAFVGGAFREAIGGTFAAGVWRHLAATWDGASIRAYVNGTLVRTVASPAPPATTAALLVGQTVSAERFVGDVDEVRLYAFVLSATQIAADRDRPVTMAGATTTTPPPATTSTSSSSSSTRSTSTTSTSSTSTTTSTVICCKPSAVPCP